MDQHNSAPHMVSYFKQYNYLLNCDEKYYNQNLVESQRIDLHDYSLERIISFDKHDIFHCQMSVFTHKLIHAILSCQLNHSNYKFNIIHGKGINSKTKNVSILKHIIHFNLDCLGINYECRETNKGVTIIEISPSTREILQRNNYLYLR